MNLYSSQTYLDDLTCAAQFLHERYAFSTESFLITGVGGLICSAAADVLLTYNEIYQTDVQIYAAARSEDRLRARFKDRFALPTFHFVPYDATKPFTFGEHVDYIIHGAGNAYPAAIAQQPVETMLANFNGTHELLRLSMAQQCRRVLFISSSEVYGQKLDSAKAMEPFDEHEYGMVDILNPRSSYASAKRAAETLCASYAAELGVDTVMVRPGHIYGPTASREDNRVSSMFAYRAASGQDLILKSDGSQLRSYCYMLDAATAIITILLSGRGGEAYNISNPESVMSIRQLAEQFADRGGVQVVFDLPDEAEKKAFNPMPNSSLKSDRLQALGWRGLFDARLGTAHAIRVLQEAEDGIGADNIAG